MADAPLNIVSLAGTPIVQLQDNRPTLVAKGFRPDPGQVSLRAKPIMVQRGADFGMPQAPMQELNTDGSAKGNVRASQEGVIKIKKQATTGPYNPANSRAREAPPAVVAEQAQLATAPYNVDRNVSNEDALAGIDRTQAPAQDLPELAPQAPTQAYRTPGPPAPRTAAPVSSKTKVTMTGGGLPMKIVAFYPEVIISASLIVLIGVNDDQSAITEPPETPASVSPLNLNINGVDYQCLGANLSFERDGVTHYALLRA